MKIGMCIGTGPDSVKSRFALELAKTAIENDMELEIFLFDNGIYNALQNSSVKCITKELKNLANSDVAISICSNMGKFRGVNKNNVAEYVDISSLIAFSGLINSSDLVVTTL